MTKSVGQCVLVSHSEAGVNDCKISFAVKGVVRGAGRSIFIPSNGDSSQEFTASVYLSQV